VANTLFFNKIQPCSVWNLPKPGTKRLNEPPESSPGLSEAIPGFGSQEHHADGQKLSWMIWDDN
jgi:hypothetical protein